MPDLANLFMSEQGSSNLYDVLGISKGADEKEIRRKYKTLATKEHPDKGGDQARFRLVQQAYEVLSDPSKRREYDTTGKISKTVEEDFIDSFAGGTFRDRSRATTSIKPLAEQLALRQAQAEQSHTSGFEAWLRSRGTQGVKTFTADDVVEQFGVVKGSYDAVTLPNIKAFAVSCQRAGQPKEVLTLDQKPIPHELEWGEVLVSMRAVPINPADLYTVQTGGLYGLESTPKDLPFVPGHDGIGIIAKVGPGTKAISEGDWVLPLVPHQGTWQSLMITKEKNVLRIPQECMPMEQAAALREMITAYRLLEDANMKPGDCLLLNAANGSIGQCILQLAALLRLRAVAVISEHAEFEKTAAWLRSLGAAEVLLDSGSVRSELDKLKFFARPKLALDAVGGLSTNRLSDALSEGGQLIIYGCASGINPQWNWKSWIFQGLKVRGFNTRRWMSENKKKVPALIDSLSKLVCAGKLTVAVTEYEMSSEFDEALDHAMDRGKNTKVVLKVIDIGEQY